MIELVFASSNTNKIREVKKLLDDLPIKILSFEDLDFKEEIHEPFNTIEENARAKADFIFKKYGKNVFADDTGLEIEALNGEPGVKSARYAGEPANSKNNIDLVLSKMKKTENRKAQFKTVIALILEGEYNFFEGIVKGSIIEEQLGSDGFGYDPIFKPKGYELTFSQMDINQKNQISHRGLAMKEFKEFIKSRF